MILSVVAACGARPVQPSQPSGPLAAIEARVDLEGASVGRSAARATVVFVFASWCQHCHHELAILGRLRAEHPALRILGVNYRGHEEYDHRGNSIAVKRYIAEHASWMRVVPADESLFETLGRPPKVPTMFIYDRAGALVATYDRRDRAMPDASELAAILRRLGA